MLSFGGFAAGDAAQHLVDGGPADQFLADFGVAFVVAGESSVGGQPGEGSLDDPALGVDLESTLPAGLRTMSIVMSLTPVDFLARVVAPGVFADGVGSFDRLRVDDAGRGLRIAALGQADLLA